MKMLRVVLIASNFLEAPNGGGAGGNQQPAGAFSLRERCDCRDINPHAAANDSRAVALRTREHLAKSMYQTQTATSLCARYRIAQVRIAQVYEAITNRCADQPLPATTAPL
jgi:hypothetical protein